ncbi:hypothetical protein LPTSP4_06970 [Leptospira ryugenii]|uniref:Uncharacterized protein n=1 Tax=Leptospira ryugenii TaxID=1917863 RepID=A0A2P2DX25_9LEPT|nr:hypothetical protein LPTSP4_06970 [Leptospira ryugenii]
MVWFIIYHHRYINKYQRGNEEAGKRKNMSLKKPKSLFCKKVSGEADE